MRIAWCTPHGAHNPSPFLICGNLQSEGMLQWGALRRILVCCSVGMQGRQPAGSWWECGPDLMPRRPDTYDITQFTKTEFGFGYQAKS
eukprot:366562-Chlamydomonas_euryale.AAC.19